MKLFHEVTVSGFISDGKGSKNTVFRFGVKLLEYLERGIQIVLKVGLHYCIFSPSNICELLRQFIDVCVCECVYKSIKFNVFYV